MPRTKQGLPLGSHQMKALEAGTGDDGSPHRAAITVLSGVGLTGTPGPPRALVPSSCPGGDEHCCIQEQGKQGLDAGLQLGVCSYEESPQEMGHGWP